VLEVTTTGLTSKEAVAFRDWCAALPEVASVTILPARPIRVFELTMRTPNDEKACKSLREILKPTLYNAAVHTSFVSGGPRDGAFFFGFALMHRPSDNDCRKLQGALVKACGKYGETVAHDTKRSTLIVLTVDWLRSSKLPSFDVLPVCGIRTAGLVQIPMGVSPTVEEYIRFMRGYWTA